MENNKKNDALNIDLQLFPNVYWFKKAYKYKYAEFNEYDVHAKMSFRNRFWVAGADGRLSLSVPILEARNEKQLYRDVKIAGGTWAMDHFRGLCSCYNRSPWFEHYRDGLADIYKKEYKYLLDLNLECLAWVNSQFGAPLQWSFHSTAENHPSGGTRRVAPDGCDYTNFFRPANQEEWIREGGDTIRYVQVFEERTGFIPGLSILDLLFCEGPGALREW